MELNLTGVTSVLVTPIRSRAQLDFLYSQLLRLSELRQYLFDMSEDKRLLLLAALQVVTVNPGEFIFHKGDVSDCLYTLLEGVVGIYDGYGVHSPLVATLNVGKVFGERGLVRKTARIFSALAMNQCLLLKLRAVDFKVSLESAFRQRLDEKLVYINKYLPGAKNMFSALKEKLAYSLNMLFQRKGHRLLSQGGFTDQLCFIMSGECRVSQTILGVLNTVVTLPPGGLFGDECVLLDRPSSYNIDVSVEGTRVYVLTKEDALQFIPESVLNSMRRHCELKFRNRHDILRKSRITPSPLAFATQQSDSTFHYASPYAKRKLAHARKSQPSLQTCDSERIESLRLDLFNCTPFARDLDEEDDRRAKTWRSHKSTFS